MQKCVPSTSFSYLSRAAYCLEFFSARIRAVITCLLEVSGTFNCLPFACVCVYTYVCLRNECQKQGINQIVLKITYCNTRGFPFPTYICSLYIQQPPIHTLNFYNVHTSSVLVFKVKYFHEFMTFQKYNNTLHFNEV